jgi:mono/diheme cytochrome c family protein
MIGADGRCRIILEAMIGGRKLRPEPGEMCVAVQSVAGEPFVLVKSEAVGDQLTDEAWDRVAGRTEAALVAFDDQNRRRAATSQDGFWDQRQQRARQWAAEHPAPAVPKLKSAGTHHPVDAFIAAKIERALAAASSSEAAAAKQFHETVLPILAQNCFRCHGEKEKGGLRLNTRASALQAGKSGQPAIVPSKPAASALLARVRATEKAKRMPPGDTALKPEQIATLEAWIAAGAAWPEPPVTAAQVAQPPLADDAAFLRRVTLDTLGVPPTQAQARAFFADGAPDKRTRLIDRLLTDERFADHWMSYWQDVLAENPNMLKPSLNNSGPFRWFLYDALRDNKPFDRLVTELILLRGTIPEGGSAGFGLAADNDAPFAAKGHILGNAFLGIELQCARCHDSPYHSTKQRDLYSLAAMLQRRAVTVPKTSMVPTAFFEKKARESLIQVTLPPGQPIQPQWPFAKTCGVTDDASLDPLLHDPKDTRERLAALITAPQNQRFAPVLVNRVWKRLVGAGLVEPAHDWEGHAPSHPQLLDWLAHELVTHDYQLKHVVRLILTSQTYQREARGNNLQAGPERRFFAAPERRRLSAEQVVDSLFTAAGKRMDVEEITFDPDSRRPSSQMISLGAPRRAWMFATLSNERDRPSLSLPRAQAVADVLEAFGWTGSRQNPRTDRETDPNVLQPGVLANSVMTGWITRVSADSALAQLAVEARSPEGLVDAIFLRFLTRKPEAEERQRFAAALTPGFADRLVPPERIVRPTPPPRLSKVSWATHLRAEANTIKLEMERRARAGDPPDPRLAPAWRERLEDVAWSVINSPEFVWLP